MFEVKDIQSSKKIFSTNTNCKVSKPKIFLLTKMYTPKIETGKRKAENSPLFLNKKSMRFVVQKNGDNKKNFHENDITNEGRWTKEEHDKFLDGIAQYGINWKKVKTFINSRTSVQVRSHAQKFYQKLKMCKDEQLGIDFTKDNISSIKDMIYQIKEKKSNYNIKYILNYLSNKFDHIKKPKNFNFQNYVNNFLENNETLNFNNNLIINQNNEVNLPNFIPQFLNNNQINNNSFPLNNNILSNNNINFFAHQNALTNLLLMNNINNECLINPYFNNYNNNYIAINNILSNLNNPFFVSMADKLISQLNLNNNNLSDDNLIKGSINNKANDLGLNTYDNLVNSNFINTNLDNYNNLSNIILNTLKRNPNEIPCNNILNPDNLINNDCIKKENDDKNKLCLQDYNIYDNNIINIYNLLCNNPINIAINDINSNVNNNIYGVLNDNVNNKNMEENNLVNNNLKN